MRHGGFVVGSSIVELLFEILQLEENGLGSKDIGEIKKGTNSMVSLMTVLNNSLGSTEVLVVIGFGVFLGTLEWKAILLVGSGPEVLDSVDMKSKGG